jgi:hypothetical protein
MCACRESNVRKSAEKFHPFYAAAVFPWWLNALYILPPALLSSFLFLRLCEEKYVCITQISHACYMSLEINV